MAKKSILSISEAAALDRVMSQTGWTLNDVEKMIEDASLCRAIRDVVRGHAKVEIVEPVIDCDADPEIPQGCSLENHERQKQVLFAPAKVEFFLTEKQQIGRDNGSEVRAAIAGKRKMNANVLDWLLFHPAFIPESWKTVRVYFWGSIFRTTFNQLAVRFLVWVPGANRWEAVLHELSGTWDAERVAAVLGE